MPSKTILSEIQQAFVVQDYSKGVSLRNLYKKYHITRVSLFEILNNYNILQRKRSYNHSLKIENLSVLFAGDTQESKYWIGFLMADGGIVENKVKLELSSKDVDHIYKFRKYLKSNHPIVYRKDRDTFTFNFRSDEAVESLTKVGVTRKKSFTAYATDDMSKDKHFWRGVIDGDGSLLCSKTTPYISLVGSEALLSQWLAYVKIIEPRTTATVNPIGKIFRLIVGGKYALSLIKELYFNCSIALDRKQKLAVEFCINLRIVVKK